MNATRWAVAFFVAVLLMIALAAMDRWGR